MTAEAPLITAEAFRARVRGGRVTVVGAARSGLGAARLLARQGADVFLTDRAEAAPGVAEALAQHGVATEFGGHSARALDADLVVLSPGVPSTAPLVQDAQRRGLPVVSEIEAASWYCRAPIVAVTGSNGKTTTTTLIAHVLRQAGREIAVAGNIGDAFSDCADTVAPDALVVLEVSSFQLDHIATFRPRVAVLLNITPDHLDRYGNDLDRYAAAKFRLFENLAPGDVLAYNADDDRVRRHAEALVAARGPAPAPFSIERELPLGAFVRTDADGEQIVLSFPESTSSSLAGAVEPLTPASAIRAEPLMYTSDLALRGRHNLYNSLAAAIVARSVEIRSDVVRASLTSFEGVPHRLEAVRTVGGVAFVNDSKATNVNAVWYALESFPDRAADGRGVVLIAGGRDKGNDYDPLRRLVADKVKGIVAIGEGADAIERDLGPSTDRVVRADSMEDAVQFARLIAEPGDTVLLSPACASFDMFENYEDRGDTFKRLVHAL
jgi:UDP-N-acetylmuramoylalanine--D-glutamate ligase